MSKTGKNGFRFDLRVANGAFGARAPACRGYRRRVYRGATGRTGPRCDSLTPELCIPILAVRGAPSGRGMAAAALISAMKKAAETLYPP